jgi:ubiquinone/menaquinone biosynthesis C-methylase UbiE
MWEATAFGRQNQSRREAWIGAKLENLQPGLRILDAGAGEQKYKMYCKHLNYTSQDFAKYDGQGNNAGLQTESWNTSAIDIISDITDIPEKDKSFDAILCSEVFEHIPEPVKAIHEFSRLLKKGGVLILTAPFCSLTHFAPYHYYSGFNRYFYEKMLPEEGFSIEEITPNGNFFEYLAQEIQYRIPNKYSQATVSASEKRTMKKMLEMLQRMDKTDAGSSEILCFGYHVLAKKI